MQSFSGKVSVVGTSGPGVMGADYILFVSSKTTDPCRYEAAAYSQCCQTESAHNR